MSGADTRAVPVLLYHAVGNDPSAWIAPFTVTAAMLARHLDVVIASGRTPLTVSAYAAALAGTAALPDSPVLITFDDGYADLVDVVAPLLAARDLPATVFITSDFLDHRSPGGDVMLSTAGALELADAGHEIGAHSVSHPQLDTLRRAELWHELADGRRALQDRLGLPVRHLAYPHGYSSPRVRRLAMRAGYASACAVRNAFSHPSDRLDAIARLTVTAATTDDTVRRWLAGEGARRATRRDGLATRGWRIYRRARRHR